MRIPRANLVRHFENSCQSLRLNPGIGTRFSQSREHIFSRNVADKIVSRKRAAAKPRQRAVEPSAAGFISRKNLFFRVFGAAGPPA